MEPERSDDPMLLGEEKTQLPAKPISKAVQTFQQFAERCGGHFDRLTSFIAPYNEQEQKAPENIAHSSIVFGLFMMAMIFVVFGLWATLAPLDSAAIAPGKVILDSNKKEIAHLEGGIVEEILVAEGMRVEEGQTLLRLDSTAAKARYDLYRGQFIAAKTTEARLLAERDNKEETIFSDELLALEQEDTMVAENLDSQRRLFISRRESLQGREDVLQQKVKQLDEEINGLNQQIKSANSQLSLLNQEIADVRTLVGKQLSPKSRLLALERRQAEIQGQRGEQQAMISRAKQAINEAKIEMYNLKTERQNEVVKELRETQTRLSDLQEQIRTAEDVARRIEVKAPIGGVVTGLNVHTRGGVVAPGEVLMNIVPSEDLLIVEARVQPQDIDVVRTGLMARVRLVAFKVRNVPPVEGEVINVSADRFEDERSGQPYFLARVAVDQDQLDKLDNVKLSPGMPVEVLIVTGSRTMLSYLWSPIRDSFNRSFREQ